jgi:hypothetical protein
MERCRKRVRRFPRDAAAGGTAAGIAAPYGLAAAIVVGFSPMAATSLAMHCDRLSRADAGIARHLDLSAVNLRHEVRW